MPSVHAAEEDALVRNAAFDFLREQANLHGDTVPFQVRDAELLDAAHIVPDSDPRGRRTVDNGLALCKLHHAAFDRHFVGVRPDLIVTVRADVLRGEDGPMLLHGLKGIHDQSIHIPRLAAQQPDRELLAIRYESFRRTG